MTTVTETNATILDFPTMQPVEHPSWCERSICAEQESEPGWGCHIGQGRGAYDAAAGFAWFPEVQAIFAPGCTSTPEVVVRVCDLDEPELNASRQHVRPMAGSRQEGRLNAAVADLERLLA
jgi:hypothetical protein